MAPELGQREVQIFEFAVQAGPDDKEAVVFAGLDFGQHFDQVELGDVENGETCEVGM